MRCCGRFDIPPAPPVMQLRSENFYQNSLRSASPPTPEQPDFVCGTKPDFQHAACQNPSVLQPLEMACSKSKHPLSSVSGRKRYNTLDFTWQSRVPTRCFHPYWKPGSQGTCSPFTIPARLCICIYKPRKCLYEHIPKRKKSPEFSSEKKRNSLGARAVVLRLLLTLPYHKNRHKPH